jgi:hypothetical protein
MAPALNDFKPGWFFLGRVRRASDDMAMLRFTDGDYGWVTEQVKAWPIAAKEGWSRCSRAATPLGARPQRRSTSGSRGTELGLETGFAVRAWAGGHRGAEPAYLLRATTS